MKQFVVLRAPSRNRGEVLGTAARAFGARAAWPEPSGIQRDGPGYCELIVWGRDAEDVLEPSAAAIITGLAQLDEGGERMSPRMLLQRVATAGVDTLAQLAPPQSGVLAFGDPLQIVAATDHVGLSAIYEATLDGVAVAASSSRLIAALLGCPLDADALSALSALGEFPATDTPFADVRRLAAGEYVRLDGERAGTWRYGAPIAAVRGAGDTNAAVRRGVEAVRGSVDACLAAYPEATIELSGGLDSRVILASILAAGRRPAEAMTLGEPGHPDVVVAEQLAARYGIPHRRVDVSDMQSLTPADALALVDTAGRRRDYSGNCVALGVLDWVEPKAGSRPRFSGQNGELARGFYYPLQPPWPRTTDALTRALVRWRLMANERASSELFGAEVNAAGEQRAMDTTAALLERTGASWLTATDFLYLDWRMQRWVGTDWSAAIQTRPILAPFFQRRYLEWALGAAPRLKRGSKLLARVLDAIDPELARLPIVGGGSAHTIFAPRPADRVQQAGRTGNKVAVKLRQRFVDSGKAPVGAGLLAQRALEGLVEERSGLEAVARLPFVSSEYVERVLSTRDASPATVGLLVTLRGLARDAADAQAQS